MVILPMAIRRKAIRRTEILNLQRLRQRARSSQFEGLLLALKNHKPVRRVLSTRSLRAFPKIKTKGKTKAKTKVMGKIMAKPKAKIMGHISRTNQTNTTMAMQLKQPHHLK